MINFQFCTVCSSSHTEILLQLLPFIAEMSSDSYKVSDVISSIWNKPLSDFGEDDLAGKLHMYIK